MSVAKRVWVPRLAWFLATTLTGGGCDLGTKAWAESALAQLPGQSITIVEPWFQLALAYNRGTAFSFIPDLGAMRWVLGIFALVVVIALAIMVARSSSDKGDALALGAIAGGAIGNGVDRMLRLAPGGGTGVVDFIKIGLPGGPTWPTFNVADALVACGAIAVLLRRLRWRKVAA